MKFLLILAFLASCLAQDTTKCCDSCAAGTDKYYSIPTLFPKNCGESCIAPDDYNMYKKLEPQLTKATTDHPCEEQGFVTFVGSEVHSLGPVHVALDMYTAKDLDQDSADRTNSEDVILIPDSDAAFVETAAVLFAPGFGIAPEQYTPLGKALQSLFAEKKVGLYFACPHFPGDISTINLKGGLNRVAKKLRDAGIPADHRTFYAGHSVGGALLPYTLQDLDNLQEGFNKPDGMILMASFLVHAFRSEGDFELGPGQYSFPNAPVLTIGGELDGLARVPRFAEAIQTQIVQSNDPAKARKTLPVTIIQGMNHMQWASGEIPRNVLNKDLQAEITPAQAHAAAAADVVAFAVDGVMNDNWSTLEKRQDESAAFAQPMIEAMKLEGYHQFAPPCLCEALDEYGGLEYGTCPQQPGCTAGSPWTQVAQQLMVHNPKYKKSEGIVVEAVDSMHIVTEEDPSCHLPHVHEGIDRVTGLSIENAVANANPGSGDSPSLCADPQLCTLKTTTVTQLKYDTGSEMDIWRIDIGNDNIDTSYYPITASEMKSKMKSRQSLLQAANVTDAVTGKSTFDDLDDPSEGNCAEINDAAIQWAYENAPASTRARYEKYGQKMITADGDKKVCAAGPCWIWASLEYEGRRGDGDVVINSPSFAFRNKNPYPCDEKKYPVDDRKVVLPCTAGMHYCKLVSPARVMEWMMVDSLRLNYSLKVMDKD